MSKFPEARKAKTFTPAWMRSARALYGAAFEPKKKGDLAESMADWSEMSEEERSFVQAHLQYVGLQAQLGTQKILRELRALFEEVGDEVIEAIEAGFEDPEEGPEVAEDEAADGEGDYEAADGATDAATDGPRLVAVPDPEAVEASVADVIELRGEDERGGGAEGGEEPEFDEPGGA